MNRLDRGGDPRRSARQPGAKEAPNLLSGDGGESFQPAWAFRRRYVDALPISVDSSSSLCFDRIAERGPRLQHSDDAFTGSTSAADTYSHAHWRSYDLIQRDSKHRSTTSPDCRDAT